VLLGAAAAAAASEQQLHPAAARLIYTSWFTTDCFATVRVGLLAVASSLHDCVVKRLVRMYAHALCGPVVLLSLYDVG